MTDFRLAPTYTPESYSLVFTPDIPAKTFTCTEVIKFVKNGDGDFADLFADPSIKIESVTQNDTPLKFTHENLRVHIYKGDSDLTEVVIKFKGSLDQKSLGWYYINDRCCSSQLEATHARKMFVCFDEPSVKSTFDITVHVPKDLMALSNMPAKSIALNEDKRTYTFHRTPPMCTYLVALAVGEFDVLTGFTSRGVPVDVYACSGKSDYLQFPLDEAVKVLDWYDDFFQVPFPLPRMQLLAVPEFQMGAMENYGLLIFREECLLAKAGATSANSLRNIAETIAHEIAHQWSGDAVSPTFWDCLWLNEGFATIFPFMAFQDIHPDWHYWEMFQRANTKRALVTDHSDHTHAIHVEVRSDEEIESVFDDISYCKAACVIRMLMIKLGVDDFRKSLMTYFREFNNKCASTSDLCNIFTRVLGVDMKPFFDAWTLQKNYPIVILEDDGTLHQKRFSQTGLFDDRSWPIPLVIVESKGGVVSEKTIELNKDPIKVDTSADWVKVNKDGASLCRVWQKGKYFTTLLDALKQGSLSVIDRWSILADYQAFAEAGLVSCGDLIQLLKAFDKESECLVATELCQSLKFLMKLFVEHKSQLAALGSSILKQILNSIGKEPRENEADDLKQLRATLFGDLSIACHDQETIDYLKPVWEKFLANRDSVDPNMWAMILRVGNMYFNGFDAVLEMSRNDPNPSVKSDACVALGFCPSEKIDECLEIALKAQLQDVVFDMIGVALNPNSGRKMWDFFIANFDKIFEMFSSISFNIPYLIDYGAGCLNNADECEKISKFFEEHPTPVAARSIQQAIERIKNRAAIIARDSESVAKALA